MGRGDSVIEDEDEDEDEDGGEDEDEDDADADADADADVDGLFILITRTGERSSARMQAMQGS